MRKTKIVCTIGPSSESLENTKKLINAGMNVARLNFSHGDFEEHGNRIKNIRQACQELGTTVAILLDTKGPEIRLGKLADEYELIQGDTVTLTTEEIVGDQNRIPVTYANLPSDVEVGSTILIDDGLIGLTVEEIQGTEIKCRIVNSGPVKSKKGVNVPGVHISLPGITEKDANDIVFGIEQNVDFIAASFVRKATDVLEIRELLEKHNASHIQIISKIENQQGVDNLDEILEVSDGLMVARGDLGVEIPAEEVPLVQKEMIQKCNRAGKPVITATQMLDSMQRNPRPTRAEASDVANAIFDGTDAIMLSGETAAGKYPVESVQTMSRIAVRAESALDYREIFTKQANAQQTTVTEAISQAVANSALDLNAKAIITSTESGYTARMVSKYRPKSPIIAVTPIESVMRRLALSWGVIPVQGTPAETTDEMFDIAVRGGIDSGNVKLGDTVIITAGVPVGRSGSTNLIKIHTIGEMIAKGQGIGSQSATGKVVVARTPQEAIAKTTEGSILVTVSTDKEYMPAIQKAAAVITEMGGITSHAAIVALNLGIPVILGVQNALELLQDGSEVTVYAEVGIIYSGQAKVL
ncbi:pyruvate kinase [Paenibacillus baekrokdamisoli]|uniref:Pyruvate kinase n=1 Tax=Paenibacillus baekrokdamisoli TaxID=1712516 RepID=A0A3G9IT99_9BACL|nr:pyruvate kinase [Paenibacillus baekrokdamisoli]MBB3071065.1 pyruvate kinase [Paenibacillus baekrokdamisoli]BBH21482.1 pyruvate kinase [Paenibacillus baekrokdamisoli]